MTMISSYHGWHWFRSILVVFVYLLSVIYAQSDAIRLQNAIRDLANQQLGVQDSTDYFNQLSYTLIKDDESHSRGQKVIQEMAADLSNRLQNHAVMVKSNLRDVLYQTSSNTAINNCGLVVGREYDSRFRAMVDLNSMCVEGIAQQSQLMKRIVLERMKGNLQSEPTLRWQYIITEDGFLFRYPAIGLDVNSDVYDPRLLPRYRLTRNPEKRDVVILLQTSSSINVAFGAARVAANTILNSLNLDDRVAILAFSTTVSTAASLGPYGDICYGSQLSDVNPTTRDQLKFFVDHLPSPSGNANYSKAFTAAFQMFRDSQPLTTDRSIVLLTDGSNLINDYNNTVNAIRNGNQQFGNKVAIYVYSFSIRDSIVNVPLTKLARQDFVDMSAGEPTTTDLKPIDSSSDIRSQMSNFFSTVKTDVNAPVVFSLPFYDQLSGDLCMSLCLPFTLSDGPSGTACVDVTISSLFREVVYFEQSSSSYVFLVDGKGSVLIHPLLPSPSSSSNETKPVSLNQIESDDRGMITILQQDMTNSTKFQDTVTINSRQVFPRGFTPLEGVNTVAVSSTYQWQRVNGTNFSVCLVTTDGYVNISVEWTENRYPSVFLADTFLDVHADLPQKVCNYHNSVVVVKNLSSVKLSPQNYYDPQLYLDWPITTQLVSNQTQFLQGEAELNPDIKSNVRAAVASTAFLELIWANRPFDVALWRYIGLREGIFRVFPATYFAKQYDPTKRSWYRQAVANPNAYALYGPYADAPTDICLVTLAKAIIRNTERTTSSTIIGVMAMDFKLNNFNKILKDNFPSCSKATEMCFMMDQGGFVIIHPDFISSSDKCPDFTDQHITCLEKFVAQQMINIGVLVSDFCVSFVNMNKIKYWKVILNSENITTPFFDVYAIHSTNVYVVQIHKKNLPPADSTITCAHACDAQHDSDGPQGTCSSIISKSNLSLTCEVPCYTATQYSQVCLGQLQQVNGGGKGGPPCIPPPPSLTGLFVNLSKTQLCNCDTECVSNTGTSSAPNLLPLLALLVLFLVPVIVLVVLCRMKSREKSRLNKNSVVTVSDAYNADTYAVIPDSGYCDFGEVRYEGAVVYSQEQGTPFGYYVNDFTEMAETPANQMNAAESYNTDKQPQENNNACVDSTYITTGNFKQQDHGVPDENRGTQSIGTGRERFETSHVTDLHVISDSMQTSTSPAHTATAAAAATTTSTTTVEQNPTSDLDSNTTHAKLSMNSLAHTIDSTGEISVKQEPVASKRGGAAAEAPQQPTITFV